jgi:hypothetical protein
MHAIGSPQGKSIAEEFYRNGGGKSGVHNAVCATLRCEPSATR